MYNEVLRFVLFITSLLIVALLAGGCGTAKESVASQKSEAVPPSDLFSSPASGSAVQPQSHSLAAGTVVSLRLTTVVDSSIPMGGFIMGIVTDDVKGADGRLAIPAGAQTAIAVRESSKTGAVSVLRMGLFSINIGGHQYPLSTGAHDAATVVITEDAGKDAAHSSVHLQYDTRLDFKLENAVQLR